MLLLKTEKNSFLKQFPNDTESETLQKVSKN